MQAKKEENGVQLLKTPVHRTDLQGETKENNEPAAATGIEKEIAASLSPRF